VLERRAARQFFRPSAFAELSTTAKPRTVGRVGSGQFDRSLRRSRVYDLSRARAARPARCGRVNRPPGADRPPRDQLGSTTATESQRGRPLARWPAAIDGELGAGRVACRAAAGARRRLPRCAAGPELDNALARALTTRPLGTAGARRAGGRPARRVRPRGSRTRPPGRAAGPPRHRSRSSRCAAPPSPPPPIGAAALLSPAAAPPELTGVPPLRRRARRAPAVGATCLGGGRAVGRSACGAGALSSPRKVAPSPGLLGRPVPGACLYVAGAPAPTRAERDLLALAPLEAGGLSSRRCASEEDALIGSRHTSRVRLSALACHSFRSGSRLSQIRS